ncbi:MAG: DUF2786 domain-containing protein [Pirellula sp.]
MPRIEKFQWNDGGRSTCGFVGMTGDCVTRSISIATGIAYREVYQTLKERYGSSPRNGVPESIYGPYLKEIQWFVEPQKNPGDSLDAFDFEDGISIVLIRDIFARKSHLCTVVDRVLHDTWDPRDDEKDFIVVSQWRPSQNALLNSRFANGLSDTRHHADLTQAEFEKIIHRLRAIDNTARNQAATEGERENALRMMQSLMLRHNLSREDLGNQEGVDSMSYSRIACPMNGSKSLNWEKELANYVVHQIFPLTQWYSGRKGHRTLFYFYGPKNDVENAVQLYRELLLTIATAAKLLYGGYSRGSGASYAEGYVNSLPKAEQIAGNAPDQLPPKGKSHPASPNAHPQSALTLMQQRSLMVHEKSKEWLLHECGIRLISTTRKLRDFRDPTAESIGRKHGSEHRIDPPSAPKRLH